VALLLVATGDGKGKTTSALGCALRAAGHGMRVLVVQFLKGGIESGEQRLLSRHGRDLGIGILTLGGGFVRKVDEAARRRTSEWLETAGKAIDDARPEFCVLDELCVALNMGLCDRESAEALIDAALAYGHVMVTGRGAPEWLTSRADTVTVIEDVRHPFREGAEARPGVEF